MDKKQILKKVRKAEEERPFVRRCLDTNICPVCGGPCYSQGSPHPFLELYECKSDECDFKQSVSI